MVVFQHHNVIRVGTSIESDAQYTILMFSIPLHLSRHLYPCIICQLFHFPLRFSSPLVKTTSPNDICISFAWCNMLCISLRVLRYSFVHLVSAAYLHLLIYRCRLFISGTSSSRSSSGTNSDCPYSNAFGVITGIWISSSTYNKGRLFSVTSMSKTIYPNSFWLRLALPVVLYKHCFTSPIIRSNCPPHQGALLKLNFHCISFLIKYSCILQLIFLLIWTLLVWKLDTLLRYDRNTYINLPHLISGLSVVY